MKGKLGFFGKLGLMIFFFTVLGIGVVGGVVLDREVLVAFDPSSNIPAYARSDFRLMAEAWNSIEKYYVARSAVKPKTMTYGAISGMVNALGDTGHSVFLTPSMVKQEENFAEGHFQGIGAEVQMKDGHVVIVAPLDGSPAQRAGLRPGEIIMKVDGADIAGLPLDQVVKRISGPVGTKVTLTILNPHNATLRQVTVTRATITIHNVTWQQLPGTQLADVRIAAFSRGVTDDLQQVLKTIHRQHLQGIVLDLRDDPGGLLYEAIGVASQFLSSGNVLLEKNAQGEETPVPVKPGAIAPDIPMVVLVNGGTASAAEIVAGALQDAHRATILGETTFGTGTVLQEFPLSDGSNLLLAVEEWLTPDGHTIWHKGITPNRLVSLPLDITPLFPLAERDMTPDQLQASPDKQLLAAIKVLQQGQTPKKPSQPPVKQVGISV